MALVNISLNVLVDWNWASLTYSIILSMLEQDSVWSGLTKLSKWHGSCVGYNHTNKKYTLLLLLYIYIYIYIGWEIDNILLILLSFNFLYCKFDIIQTNSIVCAKSDGYKKTRARLSLMCHASMVLGAFIQWFLWCEPHACPTVIYLY